MIKYWLLRILAPAAGRMPRVSYRVAYITGWLAWGLRPGLRRTVARNLLPFCGGDQRRAREASVAVFRNIARYYADLSSLPFRDMAAYEHSHLTIEHASRLSVLAHGGPAIIVSAHTGNPELALQALTYRGQSFVALVEPLHPPPFATAVGRLRASAGGSFVEADFNGLRTALQQLKSGGVVGIVADRDIQRNGVCVQVAGRRVRIARGPWELARRTGAVIVPAFARRRSFADQAITVYEPYYVEQTADQEADIGAAAQRFAGLLEAHLRANPGEWTVLEDFWRVHRCG